MTLSTSPLIPHIQVFWPAVEAWFAGLAVYPAGVLAFEPGVCQWFKRAAPGIVTLYRRPVADQGRYLALGEAGGALFVAECGDLSGCDYLLGVNEPTGSDAASVAAADAFYLGFARACVQRSVRPVGPNVAVGNPDNAHVVLLAPCVRAIMAAGGLVSYHSYGPVDLTHDAPWLLHRAPAQWPQRLGLPAASIPWAYTEAGWDAVNTSIPSGPWRELVRRRLLTLAGIEAQLEAYSVGCLDRGVRFAALFTCGGSDEWSDYDYAQEPELRDWLAGHWARHVGPPPPPPQPMLRVVASPYANLRSAPAVARGTDIGDLYTGAVVEPVTQTPSGDWWHVRVHATVGGVRAEVVGWVHRAEVAPA